MAKVSVKVQGGKIQHGKATPKGPAPMPKNVLVAYPGPKPQVKCQ